MSDIKGLSELNAQFDSLKKIDVKAPSLAGANVILDRAVQIVPVKTGNLRDSGKVNATEEGAEVEFSATYAAAVEFGTFKMAAQPFLRPAVDTTQAQVLNEVGSVVQKEITNE